MKTKSFFIGMCFFLGITLTHVTAQKNHTEQYWVESMGYYTPVYCDGVLADYVTGNVTAHIVDHYKKGEWQWTIVQIKGEAVGLYGEVFKVHETDRYWKPVAGILVWHYNLIGNMGNHYIGTLSYNYYTGEFIIGKTVCK